MKEAIGLTLLITHTAITVVYTLATLNHTKMYEQSDDKAKQAKNRSDRSPGERALIRLLVLLINEIGVLSLLWLEVVIFLGC